MLKRLSSSDPQCDCPVLDHLGHGDDRQEGRQDEKPGLLLGGLLSITTFHHKNLLQVGAAKQTNKLPASKMRKLKS